MIAFSSLFHSLFLFPIMSQDTLFNQPNFQSSPFNTNSLYQSDMAMQFAPSVPRSQRPQQSMNYPPFQNQNLLPQQQCKYLLIQS
jgi:hypothetical protein